MGSSSDGEAAGSSSFTVASIQLEHRMQQPKAAAFAAWRSRRFRLAAPPAAAAHFATRKTSAARATSSCCKKHRDNGENSKQNIERTQEISVSLCCSKGHPRISSSAGLATKCYRAYSPRQEEQEQK